MKVVLLSYWFPRGMGYIVNMLPRYLARAGAEVHYITMDMPHYSLNSSQAGGSYDQFKELKVMSPNQSEPYDGFHLHCLGHRIVAGHPRFVGLKEKLAKLAPDIVQSFLSIGWVALDAARLRRADNYKLFTAAHTTVSVFPLATQPGLHINLAGAKNLLTRWIPGRYVSRHTERCYAATSDCADVAIRFFGVEREKVTVAPLGVDTDLMYAAATPELVEQRQRTRHDLGIAADEILYIYTGQYTDAKNPLILAQAIEAMRARGRSVRGLFLGDGAQREAIAACRSCIVMPFVPHEQLGFYYRAADVGVWPTQESTSMLDAAACGLPIVVNDTLRATERIAGNGLTYRLNDQSSLESILESLLDPALRAQLGATGARRIASEFSWHALVGHRLSDYEAALAKSDLSRN